MQHGLCVTSFQFFHHGCAKVRFIRDFAPSFHGYSGPWLVGDVTA